MMGRRAAAIIVSVLAVTAALTASALEIVAAYLWRPLPYALSDRLVVVEYPRANGPSPRDLMSIDATTVSAVADLVVASDPESFTVIGGDAPFTVDGRWTGADVFAMFGVKPIAGRVFTRDEAMRGERVALVSEDIWREQFGGRPDAIGRTVTLRATIRRGAPDTFTIIGVLPRRFWHVEERTSLVVPLPGPRAPWLMRLREGVALEDAARRVTAIVHDQLPGVAPEWSAVVRSARDAHVEPVRPMLAATTWSVVLVALVALFNLAFLQMARGVARQREVAVRTALGASRADLVRQFARDGVSTGVVAAGGAVAITWLLIRTGVPIVEEYLGRILPGGMTIGSDPVTYAAVFAITIGVAVVLSLVMLPASRSATLAAALSGNPSFTDSRRGLAARHAIVTLQIGMAFCLLVGAAMMVRTAWHLGRLELGFDPIGVLTANLTLPEQTYRTLDERREFFRTLIDRIALVPDVEAAGLTGWLPFRIGPSITVIPEDAPLSSAAAAMQGVDAGYFTAIRMRLQDGRYLSADDRAGRTPAAVISAALARELWGDATAIGRTFRIKFSPEPGRGFGPYTVVGVTDDVRQSVMSPSPPQVYLAFHQQPLAGNAFLHIRTRGANPLDAAPAIARIVRDINPDLALGSVRSLAASVDQDGLRPRLLARALAAFATLAMVIATIGLYAVSAWIAQLRQREAALRVALGARRGSVTVLLVRRGAIAIAGGVMLGWIAAWPMAATLASEVRGVAVTDMATRLTTAAVLVMISIGAMLIPAWRASTANLAVLLKEQ